MHGCAGFDAGTSSAENLHKMCKMLARHGEGLFLPTIPASSPEKTLYALSQISRCMEEQKSMIDDLQNGLTDRLSEAVILGAHLEGPFLLPAYKGALEEESFLPATVENYRMLTGKYAGIVRRITIDPLCENAMNFIKYISSQGVSVTMGHTAADCETVYEGFRNGATSVTHIFNAMAPLHHRNPGPVGAALSHDDSYAELILDFLHVNKYAAKAVIKAKGVRKTVIITDSCEAAGMPDGPYKLCGRDISVINGEARMPDGRLASSTVFMDRELKNIKELGFSEEDAQYMLHDNPLDAIGLKGAMRIFADSLYTETDENGAVTGLIYEK